MPPQGDKASGSKSGVLATNRKATHDFHVHERIEAGIALHGSEVKSVRNRECSLNESYAQIVKEEVFLERMHINPYVHSCAADANPIRPRRLLLHKAEIRKLAGHVAQKGRTLVPLKVYLKRGRIKIELGLCSGKAAPDKRETLRRRTADREAQRAIAQSRGNH